MSIEDSIRAQLLTKTAVTAIVGTSTAARIRPYKLWQKDNIATGSAILFRVNRETPQNDLTHTGGLVEADVSIISCAQELADARALHEAVRLNGTNPGTGLAGDEWSLLGIDVQSCCLVYADPDFQFYRDDSDEGFYLMDAHYTLLYGETI